MIYSQYPRTKGWYHFSGMTLSEIGKISGISPERVRQQILKCNSYKAKTYKETRDVYADFKKHYDEVMG